MGTTEGNITHRQPWNKRKIVGQKASFKLEDIWALRVRLQMESRSRQPPATMWKVDQHGGVKADDDLFPSRIQGSRHLGTRQYARILERWVEELGLEPAEYGIHSMRRA